MSAGLRNSVRFTWKVKEDEKHGKREWFVRTVVVGALKIDPAHVYCLQWNAAGGGFDLTLHSQAVYERVMETAREKAEEEPFSKFRVEALCKRNLKIVTVHMYNPYVGDETVISWLSRYGKVESAVRYLRDSFGIWSGRRQFKVLLEDNPGGGGGLRHPPAYFSIGEDRGFLFYSGQPSFCRQCRSFGHMATDCTEGRCRNCGGRGHSVATCGAPKTCHGCGGEGHIVRDCPTTTRSYAEVAVQGEVSVLTPLEEALQSLSGEEGRAAARDESATDHIGANETEERMDTQVVVSLGDSLPLVGSWADCVISSEEEDTRKETIQGVRKRSSSSRGEQAESSAEATEAGPQVHRSRRRKKKLADGRAMGESREPPGSESEGRSQQASVEISSGGAGMEKTGGTPRREPPQDVSQSPVLQEHVANNDQLEDGCLPTASNHGTEGKGGGGTFVKY